MSYASDAAEGDYAEAMAEGRVPMITRTKFAPIEPPSSVTLWFCPACGRQIVGSYNLDPAKKACTKTWHLAEAVERKYVAA